MLGIVDRREVAPLAGAVLQPALAEELDRRCSRLPFGMPSFSGGSPFTSCVDLRGVEHRLDDRPPGAVVRPSRKKQLRPVWQAAPPCWRTLSTIVSRRSRRRRRDVLVVARLLALSPQAAPAAPVAGAPAAKRLLECLLVHVCEHENFSSIRVLRDDRNQSSALVEVDLDPFHDRAGDDSVGVGQMQMTPPRRRIIGRLPLTSPATADATAVRGQDALGISLQSAFFSTAAWTHERSVRSAGASARRNAEHRVHPILARLDGELELARLREIHAEIPHRRALVQLRMAIAPVVSVRRPMIALGLEELFHDRPRLRHVGRFRRVQAGPTTQRRQKAPSTTLFICEFPRVSFLSRGLLRRLELVSSPGGAGSSQAVAREYSMVRRIARNAGW